MQLSHTRPVRSAVFDDPNLVSSAGLVPMLVLARSAGLVQLADQHLSVPTDKGANAGLKVASLVAGMVGDLGIDMGRPAEMITAEMFDLPADDQPGGYHENLRFLRLDDAILNNVLMAEAIRSIPDCVARDFTDPAEASMSAGRSRAQSRWSPQKMYRGR